MAEARRGRRERRSAGLGAATREIEKLAAEAALSAEDAAGGPAPIT